MAKNSNIYTNAHKMQKGNRNRNIKQTHKNIYIQEDATLHCLFLDTSFKFKTSGHMNRII